MPDACRRRPRDLRNAGFWPNNGPLQPLGFCRPVDLLFIASYGPLVGGPSPLNPAHEFWTGTGVLDRRPRRRKSQRKRAKGAWDAFINRTPPDITFHTQGTANLCVAVRSRFQTLSSRVRGSSLSVADLSSLLCQAQNRFSTQFIHRICPLDPCPGLCPFPPPTLDRDSPTPSRLWCSLCLAHCPPPAALALRRNRNTRPSEPSIRTCDRPPTVRRHGRRCCCHGHGHGLQARRPAMLLREARVCFSETQLLGSAERGARRPCCRENGAGMLLGCASAFLCLRLHFHSKHSPRGVVPHDSRLMCMWLGGCCFFVSLRCDLDDVVPSILLAPLPPAMS